MDFGGLDSILHVTFAAKAGFDGLPAAPSGPVAPGRSSSEIPTTPLLLWLRWFPGKSLRVPIYKTYLSLK